MSSGELFHLQAEVCEETDQTDDEVSKLGDLSYSCHFKLIHLLLIGLSFTFIGTIVHQHGKHRKTDFQEYPTRRVRWLHIPKCGTSFINVLYHSFCPEIPEDAKIPAAKTEQFGSTSARYYQFNFPSDVWCNVKFSTIRLGSHDPLNECNDEDDIFVMFRHPGARIVSAFHSHFHAHGMPENKFKALLAEQEKARKNRLTTDVRIKMYAEWPGIGNCQAKMITGKKCARDYNFKEVDFHRAVKRLETFRFIGLTNEWNRSVCLFHRKFQIPHISPMEFQNSRLRNYQHPDEDDMDRYIFPSDSFDARLYDIVRKRVLEEFVQYGC